MFPAFIAGSVVGALGAVAWWALAAFANLEHAILAWIIGGAVGFAVMRANDGHGSTQAGVLAAALAIMSISAGKYMAFQTYIPSLDELVDEYAVMLQDEELIVSYVADDVAEEMQAAGQSLEWPSRPDGEEPDEMQDYPPEVWETAQTRWDGMSDGERQAYRNGVLQNYEAGMSIVLGEVDSEFFASSFSLFDIIFLGLAVVTAFQLAARGEEEEMVPVVEQDAAEDAPPPPPPSAG